MTQHEKAPAAAIPAVAQPTNPPTSRATYTVREAAKRLGISDGCAYKAAKDGTLPTIRFGDRWLVPIAALERLLCDA